MEMNRNKQKKALKLDSNLYLNKLYIYSHTTPRLVDINNKEFLDGVVYEPFMNLAITFSLSISDNITAVITEEIFEKAELDYDILYQCAIENIKGQERISSIMDTIIGIIQDDDFEGKAIDELSRDDIYVLSSKNIRFGSGYLLDNELLESIHKSIGDFVIIGSSQFELLIIADNKKIDYQSLLELNKQVNANEVRAEEVLADAIYLYSGKGLSQVA